MTLQQLEYVLTIAKEGSITKAATRLFKAQPNISNAIHELEHELDIQIFERTANGTHLTPAGEAFLPRAENILRQADQLKAMFHQKNAEVFTFQIAISRSSYITSAISDWLRSSITNSAPMEIFLHETNTHTVINSVTNMEADLGIIRIPLSQQDYFHNLFSEQKLIHQDLLQFPLRLCIKADHPLAAYDDIPYEELHKYTEIVHGDDRLTIVRQTQINGAITDCRDRSRRCIYVYDRGSQISLLDELENAYMWVSPIPEHLLKRYGMVLKVCSYAQNINKDIVIYKEERKDDPIISSCVQSMLEFSENLFYQVKCEDLQGICP